MTATLPISFLCAEPKESPTSTVTGPNCEVCSVGYITEPTPEELMDMGRELAIRIAGKAMEAHVAEWIRTGDFGERGAADAARLRMERLIKERRPEFVARLEMERGLT